MHTNTYSEQGLAIRNRKLSLFEEGREAGALPSLLGFTTKVKFQERSLLETISGLIRARKHESVTIFLHDHELKYLALGLTYRFGFKDNLHFRVNADFQIDVSKLDLFAREVGLRFNAITNGDIDITRYKEINAQEFLIFVFHPESDFEQRAALQCFKKGNVGAIFVRDFALQGVKWPFLAYRDLGFELSETSDGFGHCFSLSSRLGGYK